MGIWDSSSWCVGISLQHGATELMGSGVAAHRLSRSVARGTLGNQALVSCIGRGIIYQWTTREVLDLILIKNIYANVYQYLLSMMT